MGMTEEEHAEWRRFDRDRTAFINNLKRIPGYTEELYNTAGPYVVNPCAYTRAGRTSLSHAPAQRLIRYNLDVSVFGRQQHMIAYVWELDGEDADEILERLSPYAGFQQKTPQGRWVSRGKELFHVKKLTLASCEIERLEKQSRDVPTTRETPHPTPAAPPARPRPAGRIIDDEEHRKQAKFFSQDVRRDDPFKRPGYKGSGFLGVKPPKKFGF